MQLRSRDANTYSVRGDVPVIADSNFRSEPPKGERLDLEEVWAGEAPADKAGWDVPTILS